MVRLDIEGTEQVSLALNRLGPALADLAYEDGLVAAAGAWAAQARRNPLFASRTGTLRASIRGRRGHRRFKPSAFVFLGAISASFSKRSARRYRAERYGYILEYTGRPTLGRALGPSRPEMERAFANRVRGNLSKVEAEIQKGKLSGRTRRGLSSVVV